jgi:hypothetical protein
MPTVTQNLLVNDMMSSLILATHKLNGSKIVLFSSNITPGKTTVVGDLGVITAAGLDAKTAVTWSDPFIGDDGNTYVMASIGPFIATDADDLPVTVNGWACLDTAGTGCLAVEKFDAPRAISNEGEGVEVNPIIPYGS